MSDARARERASQLESARERACDALLEQEFGGEPPVAAILQRAGQPLQRESHARSRSWLAVAVALLGIGVAVAIAWHARSDCDDLEAAAPQDPDPSVDARWPADVRCIYRVEQLSEAPADATHLELAMPLHAARDLSRFADLRHLSVRLGMKKFAEIMRSGDEAKVRGRLDALLTTPQLRRLALQLLPVANEDLAALRHVERLQILELEGLFRPDEDLAAAAAAGGGCVIGRPFDRSLGEAVATSSRARTLRLSMPITAGGLQALAKAKLHTLILDRPFEVTPEVLLALGELTSLRHLELRCVHGAAVDDAVGGSILRYGSRGLSVAVMERIARLPELRSLTLDVCFLDHDLLQALPRQLQRLDISSCFGVDGRLADVVGAMPELREVGLPLTMADREDFRSMLRPPLTDGNAHTLRLSGEQASEIIRSRVWRALGLDGRLSEPVTAALADQPELTELTLTPTPGSESLAFVARLPKLARVTFVQANITQQQVAALNGCASLRTVVFEECMTGTRRIDLGSVLRDDVVTRSVYRVVWP